MKTSYNPLNPNDHKALRYVAKGVKVLGATLAVVLVKNKSKRIRKKK